MNKLLLISVIALFSFNTMASNAADVMAAKIVKENVKNLPVQLNANMSMESMVHLSGGGISTNTRLKYTMADLAIIAQQQGVKLDLEAMKNAMETQAKSTMCNSTDRETKDFIRVGGWYKINYVFIDGNVLHTFTVKCKS
ncbi:hypothetical protein [Vibrio sp. 10N.261.55.A7]|uniref:hypothetical protein n=1 Tax=Vibrio sp. 10N.261.55.A7 TaxID=1880851 RepID=UPI000C85C59E|nr:hypothetical protein [Vibrio sp. 10N.261.55.A7]PMJ98404.1 hypothetical protein BCU12_21820 [Vibrio sp. 10N.261.55.A7]